MPKIYISGQITGLDMKHVKTRFFEAEELLKSIGLDPVNPLKNGLPEEASWERHMIRDIEMLFECDGVLMLSNWHQSKGARIERSIANELGKIVMYESALSDNMKAVNRIKESICQVMGLPFEEYVKHDTYTYKYYARLVYAHQCKKKACISSNQIASALGRHPRNIARYGYKYTEEYNYNKEFRSIADKINNILINNVSE